MEEIWKEIQKYENYQVSNLGRIKKGNKIYKNTLMNNGYLIVSLIENKKYKKQLVHRLVAEAFIPNPNNYPVVNHKDGNKQNNRVDNLEWCSYSMNEKHAYEIGLKKKFLHKRKGKNAIHSKKVNQYDLNGNFIKKWDCIREASKKLNISESNISNNLTGYSKSAGGYRWEYLIDKKVI